MNAYRFFLWMVMWLVKHPTPKGYRRGLRWLYHKWVIAWLGWEERSIQAFGRRLCSSLLPGQETGRAVQLLDAWLKQNPLRPWRLTRVFLVLPSPEVKIRLLEVILKLTGFEPRKYELFRQALRAEQVVVREAAAQGLVTWGSVEARRILRRHRDQHGFRERTCVPLVPLAERSTRRLIRSVPPE